MPAVPSRRLGLQWPAVVTVALFLIGAWLYYKRHEEFPQIPDETVAGLELLSRKFSGPGYFHLDVSATNRPANASHPDYYVTVENAKSQINRVMSERGFGAGRTSELQSLIGKLEEPPDSRMIGESKVNVLRLNLALEQL